MNTPVGLPAIIQMFGDVAQYIQDDGIVSQAEMNQFLDYLVLPFPMIYAYDTKVVVRRMLCHKLLVPVFGKVFDDILNAGLQDKCKEYGGCYNFRSKRTSARLSTHCWGIAVDLNPRTNQMGAKGNMDEGIIEIFRDNGFKWGGDWKRPDPMHFQFAEGY
jgi:hypothetical protein